MHTTDLSVQLLWCWRDVRHEIVFCDEHVDMCAGPLITMKSLGRHFHFVPVHTTHRHPLNDRSTYNPITTNLEVPSAPGRVSNKSAGVISSRFAGDIFTKIQQNLQFYQHLPSRVTNPWDHTDPFYPSNSSVKAHLPGIDSPNIN